MCVKGRAAGSKDQAARSVASEWFVPVRPMPIIMPSATQMAPAPASPSTGRFLAPAFVAGLPTLLMLAAFDVARARVDTMYVPMATEDNENGNVGPACSAAEKLCTGRCI